MRKIILLLVLSTTIFVSTANAAPTIKPGIYKFGNCGGINGSEYTVPSGVEREYKDRFLCEETYGGYGPASCAKEAEFYVQDLFRKGEQYYKNCQSLIESWEMQCKQFVRQAAKQCSSLKTTEQLQEEENRSSQSERTRRV